MIERMIIQAGDLALEGLLERPDEGGVWGGAVVCHPHPFYGGNMHNNVVLRVVPALAQAGLAALRFNFRGVGRSQGSYAEGIGEQDDLRAALSFLATADGMAGKLLFAVGYSFGAAVVARALIRDAALASALVCIALPVGFGDLGTFAELERCVLPKLFLAGSEDDICSVPKLRALVGTLPDPKSLVVLDATDHFFHAREAELASHIARFLTALRAPA